MSWLYLERVEEELEKEINVAEDAIRVLLCQHCKDHLMDPQQRDQGQGGFGQSGEKDTKHKSLFNSSLVWGSCRKYSDGELPLDLV